MKKNVFSEFNRRFPLIEVIISLVIIGIIAAVVSPLYARYMEKARENSDIDAILKSIDAVREDASEGGQLYSLDLTQTKDGWTDTVAGEALEAVFDDVVAGENGVGGMPRALGTAWVTLDPVNGLVLHYGEPASTGD